MSVETNGERRVEVEYHVHRTTDDTIVISREVTTIPVTGRGVQWTKRESKEEHLFEVPADEVPALIERLATGLTFPADGSYI
ncbi:hypothetical protein J4U01_gp092 [Mycobacterium phage Kumao]|uniref:Uncharacterized protein n=1 Tax=Mycobacterium phage Kumao TaxID=2041344 RepID=A0A2D1GPU2_9CAUD|nr:hypothetical protein J4U01_gp092 [Mycobacterium phage Kumao]ATN94066.1 hypothetical protein SEA_KUMAO_104 [Mycobacterium phage Kumao]